MRVSPVHSSTAAAPVSAWHALAIPCTKLSKLKILNIYGQPCPPPSPPPLPVLVLLFGVCFNWQKQIFIISLSFIKRLEREREKTIGGGYTSLLLMGHTPVRISFTCCVCVCIVKRNMFESFSLFLCSLPIDHRRRRRRRSKV